MNALWRSLAQSLTLAGAILGTTGCARSPAMVEAVVPPRQQPVAQAVGQPRAVAAADTKAPPPGEQPPAPVTAKEAPPRLPDDAGGKAVGNLLAPTTRLGNPPAPQAPKALPVPPSLTGEVPTPLTIALPRRPLLPTEKGLRPRPPAEDVSASLSDEPGAVPARPAPPSQSVVRAPARTGSDADRQSLIGLPVPDRVPLEDPTTESSFQSVLNRATPNRVTPVPFVPTNLPDPFPNREAARVRTPPPEDDQPQVGPRNP